MEEKSTKERILEESITVVCKKRISGNFDE